MDRLKYSLAEESRIFDILSDFRTTEKRAYFHFIGLPVDSLDRKIPSVSFESYQEIIEEEFSDEMICQRFSSYYFNDLANSVHLPLFLAEVHLQAEKAGLAYSVSSDTSSQNMTVNALQKSRAYLELAKEIADTAKQACEMVDSLKTVGVESPQINGFKKTLTDKIMQTRFIIVPLSMFCSSTEKRSNGFDITHAFTLVTDFPDTEKDIYLIKENADSFLHIPTEDSHPSYESKLRSVIPYILE